MTLLVPRHVNEEARPASIVDGSVERMLRDRRVARLHAIAERWEDEGSEHSLAGNPRRGHYLNTVAEVPRSLAQRGAMEPMLKMFSTPGGAA